MKTTKRERWNQLLRDLRIVYSTLGHMEPEEVTWAYGWTLGELDLAVSIAMRMRRQWPHPWLDPDWAVRELFLRIEGKGDEDKRRRVIHRFKHYKGIMDFSRDYAQRLP